MPITYHSGPRGEPGFLISITGVDGVARGTVIPAYVPVDATGSVISGGGGGAVTIANSADVAGGATTDAAYTDATGAAAGTRNALLKGLYVSMRGTGVNSQNVQGGVVQASTTAVNLLPTAYYASATIPTAVTAGQWTRPWAGLSGQTIIGTGSVTAAPASTSPASNLLMDSSGSGRPTGVTNYVSDGVATLNPMRGDTNAVSMQPALSSAFWSYAAAASGILNTTTAVTLKTAAGAGVRNYIEAIQLDWEAFGSASEVVLRDGAGGTVLFRMKIGTGAAGSRTITFRPALKGTANTLLEVATLTASVTGALYVNAQGWTGV